MNAEAHLGGELTGTAELVYYLRRRKLRLPSLRMTEMRT